MAAVPEVPEQQAIHRARARMAFEVLQVALHRAIVRHNSQSKALLEIHQHPTRIEVFQRGLIFPSLTVLFDAETCEVLYHMPSRHAEASADRGAVMPGYNGDLIWINAASVAHRAPAEQLAVFLLRTATTAAFAKQRAA